MPKSTKCLRMPCRLMNPMSSRKLSPTLSSEYCVCRKLSFQTIEPLPAISPPVDAGRERLREKPVDAERLDEAEIRVDAGDLVAIATTRRRTAATERWRRCPSSAGRRAGRAARCSCRRRVRRPAASESSSRRRRCGRRVRSAGRRRQSESPDRASVSPIRREKNSSISSSGGANRALPSRDSRGMSPK